MMTRGLGPGLVCFGTIVKAPKRFTEVNLGAYSYNQMRRFLFQQLQYLAVRKSALLYGRKHFRLFFLCLFLGGNLIGLNLGLPQLFQFRLLRFDSGCKFNDVSLHSDDFFIDIFDGDLRLVL